MTRRVLAVEAPTRNRDTIYGSRSPKETTKAADDGMDFKVVFDCAMDELKKNRR